MKIVITGALGHIGSKLLRELPFTFPTAKIVLIDNLLTQRYASLFNLPKEGDYQFIEADILNYDLNSLFDNAEAVIHLAAITNAESSFEKQKEVELVNYVGTKKVAKACINTGSKLIFLSTTSVYGTQNNIIDENCSKSDYKPQSPYAESKLKAEYLLQKKGEENRFDFIICRFGTICGISPGMRFHTSINKFCWQAVTKVPLTVWNNALNQKRPYLNLKDATNAITFILQNNIFDRQIYNVLTENLTVNDVINKIRKHIQNLKIEFIDSKIMNQLSYEVLNNKFKRKGFHVKHSIQQGISETIKLLQGIKNE